MVNQLCAALLTDICHPVSMLVSLDGEGKILFVHLFDTEFCAERMRIEAAAQELWLVSGHDDGGMQPYEADIRNLQHLLKIADGRKVRLFFASEYWPCWEIGA